MKDGHIVIRFAVPNPACRAAGDEQPGSREYSYVTPGRDDGSGSNTAFPTGYVIPLLSSPPG